MTAPRKPRKAASAPPAVDPATIAAIVAALAAMGIVGVPQVVNAEAPQAEPEEDPAQGRREAAEEAQRHDAKMAKAASLIEEALPLLIRARHMPILEWMAKASDCSKATMVAQILMNGISKNQTAYREAHGKVAASSNRNLLEEAKNS